MKNMLLPAIAISLAGCMSLHDLDQQAPLKTETLQGDYLEIAQCVEARQIRAGQPGQIKMSNDRARKEALVTWNHDMGTFATFMFTETGPKTTQMKVFSAIGFRDGWMPLIKSCEGDGATASSAAG